MFEAHLKELYPTSPKINYEIKDLFTFIDRLGKTGLNSTNGSPHGPVCVAFGPFPHP